MSLEQEEKMRKKLNEISGFLKNFSDEVYKNPQNHLIDLEKDICKIESESEQAEKWVKVEIKVK